MALASLLFVSCNSASTKSKDAEAAKNSEASEETSDFEISLAQWSLHKTFFGGPISDWMEFGRLLMEDPDPEVRAQTVENHHAWVDIAKSTEFDANGNETTKDFLRMMKIVNEAGFKGYVGIEYEGSTLSEDEGIKATKALLEKVFKEI